MEINEITSEIIDSAIKVHTALGPGLLESAYEVCLAHELRKRGREVETQLPLPIRYETIYLDTAYKVDLLVEKQVIVEIKSVDKVHPVHEAQLLSYLRLSDLRVGLLINFNVTRLIEGLKRVANKYQD